MLNRQSGDRARTYLNQGGRYTIVFVKPREGVVKLLSTMPRLREERVDDDGRDPGVSKPPRLALRHGKSGMSADWGGYSGSFARPSRRRVWAPPAASPLPSYLDMGVRGAESSSSTR
jgi:hypothetical protein